MLNWFYRLKLWVFETLLSALLGKDPVFEQVRVRINTGETHEEQAVFWSKLKTWLDQPEGKHYTVFQQKEFEGLYDSLMHLDPKHSKPEEFWYLLGKVQQQNTVFGFSTTVARRVDALKKQLRMKEQAEQKAA